MMEVPRLLPTPVNTSKVPTRIPLLIGTPSLGQIRMEWANAMRSMVIPCNWGQAIMTPIGYPVWLGQNIIIHDLLTKDFEYVVLVEDDNVVHPGFLLGLSWWIERNWRAREHGGGHPIVSGLYYLKNSFTADLGPEPLIYRGGGTRAYRPLPHDWRRGWVYCDGVPTGALLVHRSIFEAFAREPDVEWVIAHNSGQEVKVRKIFEQPQFVYQTADGQMAYASGTSDLYFCKQVIDRDLLKKAGWTEAARRKYPFVVDLRPQMRVGHIDRNTGTIW